MGEVVGMKSRIEVRRVEDEDPKRDLLIASPRPARPARLALRREAAIPQVEFQPRLGTNSDPCFRS